MMCRPSSAVPIRRDFGEWTRFLYTALPCGKPVVFVASNSPMRFNDRKRRIGRISGWYRQLRGWRIFRLLLLRAGL